MPPLGVVTISCAGDFVSFVLQRADGPDPSVSMRAIRSISNKPTGLGRLPPPPNASCLRAWGVGSRFWPQSRYWAVAGGAQRVLGSRCWLQVAQRRVSRYYERPQSADAGGAWRPGRVRARADPRQDRRG